MTKEKMQEIINSLRKQKIQLGIPKIISGITFVNTSALKPTVEANPKYTVLLPGSESIPENVRKAMQDFCQFPNKEGVLDYGDGNYLVLSNMISFLSNMESAYFVLNEKV